MAEPYLHIIPARKTKMDAEAARERLSAITFMDVVYGHVKEASEEGKHGVRVSNYDDMGRLGGAYKELKEAKRLLKDLGYEVRLEKAWSRDAGCNYGGTLQIIWG